MVLKDVQDSRAQIQCKLEHVLPQNTACYQLQDGTFFLFKSDAPYELSAVVNGRKVEVKLPSIKEPLICTGVYRDSLYFYSTPPWRRTYKFYSAFVNDYNGTVEFVLINEIRTDSIRLYLAHQQPFYVFENRNDKMFEFGTLLELGFEGKKVPNMSENAVFFEHLETIFLLSAGDHVKVEEHKVVNAMIVTVPRPENTAIFSCPNSRSLYLICETQLLVFYKKVVRRFELLTPPSKKIPRVSLSIIVGVWNEMMIVRASRGSDHETWSLSIPRAGANEMFAREESEDIRSRKDKANRANLSMLMKKLTSPPAIAAIPPTDNVATEKKAPNSTGKIVTPGGKKNASAESKGGTLTKAGSLNAVAKALDSVKVSQADTTFLSEFQSKYTPVRILGRGAFGCVFEAESKLIQSRYAVKRIALSESAVESALDEVRALDRFNHPGIVRFNDAWMEKPPKGWQSGSDCQLFKELNYCGSIFTCNEDCAFLYIKMELCESTLSDWLRVNKNRDINRMKTWFKQIVAAVGYIHEMGMIHRDLKPSNILFASSDRLKICDLGVITECAYDGSQEIPKTRTSVVGTRIYMAPEQFFRGYGSKVDIFALGLILAELSVVMTTHQASETFNKYRAGRVVSVLNALPEVKNFVAWLSNVKYTKRPTCSEILEHPFLA